MTTHSTLSSVHAESPRSPRRFQLLFVCLLLITCVFAAYMPVIMHGNFIWDDDLWITNNMVLQQDNTLLDMWLKPSMTPQYYPLTLTTFYIELRLWGANPRGFIILNVLLHAASTCLLYALLRKLKIPGALLAAALFAVHPMNVESVAWITERKNTLACMFTLASALLYFSWSRSPRLLTYCGATLLFLAALLSKSVACALPPALLTLAWWQRGKFPMQHLLWLIPWFILGLIAGLHTAYFEHTRHVSTQMQDFTFSLLDRLLLVGRTWWFYPAKFLLPHPLSFFYPRWQIDPHQAWQFLFPLAVIVAFALLIALRKRLGHAPLLVATLYSLAIFPCLGFINIFPFRYSFVADHFAYLALIPLTAGLAALLAHVARRFNIAKSVQIALSALIILTLGLLSINRGQVYQGQIALWHDTSIKNPHSQAVWSLLGAAYLRENQFDLAKEKLLIAYDIPPRNPDDCGMLANACIGLGQYDQAEIFIQQMLAAKPESAGAWQTLGALRQQQKRAEEAVLCYLKSHQIAPGNASAIFNAGVLLANMGAFDKAADCFAAATRINPRWAAAHNFLGRCLAAQGNLSDAANSFARACDLSDNPEYAQDLSRVRQDLAAQKARNIAR